MRLEHIQVKLFPVAYNFMEVIHIDMKFFLYIYLIGECCIVFVNGIFQIYCIFILTIVNVRDHFP